MYGARSGELTISELIDQANKRMSEQKKKRSRGTVGSDNLSILAHPNLPVVGKPKKKDVVATLKACPNVEYLGSCSLDPSTVIRSGHTRNSDVVRIVSDALRKGRGKRGIAAAAVEEANKWRHWTGADKGLLRRLKERGSDPKPEHDMEEWAKAREAMINAMPLNVVQNITVKPSHYKPNLETSAGWPAPELTKRNIFDSRILPLLEQVESDMSFESVMLLDGWNVVVYKLKGELHLIGTEEVKARAYYVLRGETSVVVGAALSCFTNKIKNFTEDPSCVNLVGVSLYGGGANNLLQSIETCEGCAAAYYGDDGLIIMVLPSGRRYTFMPDVSSMDMNTPGSFKAMWLDHLSKFCVPDTTGEGQTQESYQASFLKVYSSLFCGARFILPYGQMVQFRNFSTTGMCGNTYYQTYVNGLVWLHKLKPICQSAVAEGGLTPESSKEDEKAMLKGLAKRLYAAMKAVGLPWKSGAYFKLYNREKVKLSPFLGHTIARHSPQHHALAYVPLGRLLASLVNPRRTPVKAGSAIVVAYVRSLALFLAGGYMYPVWVSVMQELHEAVKSTLKTLSPQHGAELTTQTAIAGVDLGEDEIYLQGILMRNGVGDLYLKPPFTVEQVLNLRTNPHANGLEINKRVDEVLETISSELVRSVGKQTSSTSAKPKQQALPQGKLRVVVVTPSGQAASPSTSASSSSSNKKKKRKLFKQKKKQQKKSVASSSLKSRATSVSSSSSSSKKKKKSKKKKDKTVASGATLNRRGSVIQQASAQLVQIQPGSASSTVTTPHLEVIAEEDDESEQESDSTSDMPEISSKTD
jgi:hypothetical protein